LLARVGSKLPSALLPAILLKLIWALALSWPAAAAVLL